MHDDQLYRGPQVCSLAGITYRQLDYWTRTGLLVPFQAARGSGSYRLFDLRGVQIAWLLGTISRLGVALPDLAHWRHLPRWSGWLVLAAGEMPQHIENPDELALWPAAVIVDLEACPMLDPSSITTEVST